MVTYNNHYRRGMGRDNILIVRLQRRHIISDHDRDYISINIDLDRGLQQLSRPLLEEIQQHHTHGCPRCRLPTKRRDQ